MNALSKPKTNRQAEVTEMLSGLQESLPSTVKSIPVQGQSLTPSQVDAQLQAYLQLCTAVATAKAQYATAVTSRKAQDLDIQDLMVALRSFLRQQFAGNPLTLATFGIDVSARTRKTTLAKATAAAKGLATKASKPKPESPAESSLVLLGAGGSSTSAAASAAPSSVPAAGK